MTFTEAKQFIVGAIAEQAALEGNPLSSNERQMLTFSEESESQRMLELNEKFEAEYDTAEYEAKIADLIKKAYQTARESPALDVWKEAFRAFDGHDVYLMVMIEEAGVWSYGSGTQPKPRPRLDRLKLLLTGVAIVGTVLAGEFAWLHWGEPATNRQVDPTLLTEFVPAILFFDC